MVHNLWENVSIIFTKKCFLLVTFISWILLAIMKIKSWFSFYYVVVFILLLHYKPKIWWVSHIFIDISLLTVLEPVIWCCSFTHWQWVSLSGFSSFWVVKEKETDFFMLLKIVVPVWFSFIKQNRSVCKHKWIGSEGDESQIR